MWRVLVPVLLLVACGEDKPGDGDVDGDTGGLGADTAEDSGEGDGSDDSAEEPDGPAVLSGTVRVALTWIDEGGDVTEYDWTEATGDVYVFGAIFVAVYTEDEQTGEQTYHDTYTISAPAIPGDEWELTVDTPEDLEGPVHLYAAMDYWNDGILSTGEPVAPWAEPIELSPGQVLDDLELVISTPWDPYWQALHSTGGSYETVGLSGTAEVVSDYVAGERCATMIYSSSDWGPYHWSIFTPADNGDGTADSAWSFATYANLGDANLRGACDANDNWLIDPADAWGTVVEGNDDDNPIQIDDEDVTDLVVRIPYAGARSTMTPSVTLSGEAYTADGFASWPAGTQLYIAALRTPPSAELSVDTLSGAYDSVIFSSDDLAGNAVDYTLTVPPNRTVYLWAYADTDGDGALNEVGEPLGNPGNNGRVDVGNASESGLDINLMAFEEPEDE